MNEGWVDARKYLLAVRRKAIFLGVDYVKGQVIDFEEQKDSSFITPIKPINTALVMKFLIFAILNLNFKYAISLRLTRSTIN